MNNDIAIPAELPQPTRPLADLSLAADMLQALGLASIAGIGAALGSGLLVLALTVLHA